MSEFEYVSRREAQAVIDEIEAFLHRVQDCVREYFTFDYQFYGCSSKKVNMITREKGGNKGFEFDVNLIPHVKYDKYSAAEIARILFAVIEHGMRKTAFDHCVRTSVLGHCMRTTALEQCAIELCTIKYDELIIDEPTNVFPIKVIDTDDCNIVHSCDFAIIRTLCKDKKQEKQCIVVDKRFGVYAWRFRLDYDIEKRLQLIADHGLKQLLRTRYIEYKNQNQIPTKKSREVFSEAVNSILYEYHL